MAQQKTYDHKLMPLALQKMSDHDNNCNQKNVAEDVRSQYRANHRAAEDVPSLTCAARAAEDVQSR